jgi:serine/threonine protein kinase
VQEYQITSELLDFFTTSKRYFTEKQIVAILRQVLLVVEYLHSRGICVGGIDPS